MYTIVGMDERKKKDVKNIIHRSKYSIILVYFKLPQKIAGMRLNINKLNKRQVDI